MGAGDMGHHADGIYFGLPENEYHADDALGSSDLKQLAVDAVDWQYDRLFGDDAETDALVFGRALHCRVLEGRAQFDALFCGELDKPDDVLVTVADLEAWLGARNIPAKGKKADLIQAAMNAPGDKPLIWDLLREDFEARNAEKTILSAKVIAQVETAAQWMQADVTLSASMQDGTFQHGAPEVSVFATVEGVRMKARFDYLIGHAIIDLKSFSTMFREVPANSITRAIVRQRYDLQAAHYVNMWHHGRDLYASGKVFGIEPDGLMRSVYSRKHPLWIWVFLKSVMAPQPYVRSLSHEEIVFGVAQNGVARAFATYRDMVAAHGAEKPWPPSNPPEALSTDDFPSWFQDT
jgi:hypothetical protein